MKVDVYKNLNKKCFSIRSREKATYGRVVAHELSVTILNPSFVVQTAGREKCLKTNTKNVHAFVRGELICNADNKAWAFTNGTERLIGYNPYKAAHFYVDGDVNSPVNENCLIATLDYNNGIIGKFNG